MIRKEKIGKNGDNREKAGKRNKENGVGLDAF